MFTWIYALSELGRRRGRAIATALGLAVGVALVAAVGALSTGLSDAQDEVLAPLEDIGTDITVTRPLRLDENADPVALGPNGNLTPEEQARFQEENEQLGLSFDELGDAGEEFAVDSFTTTDLSFASEEADAAAGVDGVAVVAPSLTLELIQVSGTVPEGGFGAPGAAGGGGGPGGGPAGFIFETQTVAGVDRSSSDLALVTPEQIVEGEYLAEGEAGARQVVLSESYAGPEGIAVGETYELDGTDYEVVGLAEAPLGGESADVYMDLGVLQAASDRRGRVNGLRVQAEGGADVAAVGERIESTFAGSRVTTAEELAGQVQGSLTEARDLVDSLGTVLAIVALVAAVVLASILMLGAVARRTRELGTLKAFGWPGRLVVRQIAAESTLIGAAGAIAGVTLGFVATLIIDAVGITLEATAETTGAAIGPPGTGEQTAAATSEVTVSAPLDPALIGLAVVLAITGALIAGAVAAGRIARLRPAAALRNVE